MNPSCVVYVGNIPYEMSEEQVTDIFRQSGPVKSFHLVIDPESGQPKGYGFCEYHDTATTASAVRNLNNYDAGARRLRVDFPTADQIRRLDKLIGPPSYGQYAQPYSMPSYGYNPPYNAYSPANPNYAYPAYPPAPNYYRGTPSHSTAIFGNEAIYRTLTQLAPNELDYMLSAVKALCLEVPAQAEQLLAANPQLSYAVFQSMVMKQYVPESTIGDLLVPPASAGPPPTDMAARNFASPLMAPVSGSPYGSVPPRSSEPVTRPYSSYMGPYVKQPSPYVGMPTGPAITSRGSTPASVPLSPMRGYAYPATTGTYPPTAVGNGIRPMTASAPAAAARSPSIPASNTTSQSTTTATQDEEATKAALIAQLMALTDEQISVLPQEQKEKIIEIRKAVSGK
ncbi:RNA-binding protein [Schizosaccharomyces cryophilus OY26]|uniref:RNA-binding protein n=1 Tax=Schizosaccharomyces cryophilus (strain OY26 / ATCC MYA-4695 / CBS 11777 / NBRC 106824 / NRRL Y48691) TaxID=653667 RepID=S9W3L1_SCHCR|nr:RNA-binding protein [Schizosaccharomyces cryophilus OY26]EPY52540.1 RNA-binding protein [Schizosaccharomyces cryophilus OY26]